MLARILRAVRDDIDPAKARRAVPGLLFIGLAVALLFVEVAPRYRFDRDIAATILVLGLLLFGIYGAFAWGEPPERR